LIYGVDDVDVELVSFLKGFYPTLFTDFRAHGGLGQLGYREGIVFNPVRCLVRVQHAEIQNSVNGQGNVVLGNGALTGHIHRLLFERAVMGYPIDERDDEIEACLNCFVEFTEPLYNKGAVLGDEFLWPT
jgi:hypothetical protein